jgi:ERF superfamily
MPKKPKRAKLQKIRQKTSKVLAVIRETPPPQEIIDLVKDPAVDPAKLKALLDMKNQERMQAAANAYAVAMSDAQAKMEPVRKDCENRQTHSKYASYAALDRAIRKHYVENGFALEYNTETMSAHDVMRIVCDVSHKAGFTKHFQIDIPIVTTGPQGKDVMTATHATMSANTYGKRGLLKMIFNIAEYGEDDDGNIAGTILINESQLKTLKESIAAAGADEEKICEFAKVDNLYDMSVVMLGRVMVALADRQRLNKTAAAPA